LISGQATGLQYQGELQLVQFALGHKQQDQLNCSEEAKQRDGQGTTTSYVEEDEVIHTPTPQQSHQLNSCCNYCRCSYRPIDATFSRGSPRSLLDVLLFWVFLFWRHLYALGSIQRKDVVVCVQLTLAYRLLVLYCKKYLVYSLKELRTVLY